MNWTPSILPDAWIVEGAEKGTKLFSRYGIDVQGDQLVRLPFEFAGAYASVKVRIVSMVLI